MTNPNDLISRKEIEKMMQEVHDSFENEPIDIKIFARAGLKIARDKLSQIDSVSTEKVTRVEVIDEHGRAWTTYNAENVNLSYQDDNKTLKVFLKSNKPDRESVNVWIPVVPSDIWSNEYAYVMVTDGVKIGPAYYDTHQGFFWHDNDLPVDPTLVKLDSFKHNLPPPNKV